ncbi:MAG TPA: hypothetical protein VF498_13260 [Anaerolineales bacterium]
MDAAHDHAFLRIPLGARLTATLNLDPPPAPPVTTGPGADATRLKANLPASVTIQFIPGAGAGRGRVSALSDFDAQIYGMAVDLKRSPNAPVYDLRLHEIKVPAKVSPSTFTVSDCQSQQLTLGSQAGLQSGAWALPVVALPYNQLGPAAGAGAVLLQLGEGLEAQWSGLPGPVLFGETLLQAAPGQLGLLGQVKGGPFTQELVLWDENLPSQPPRSSVVDVQFAKDAEIFALEQTGVEVLLAQATAIAHLDRPRRVDGSRFAVKAPGAWFGLLLNTAGEWAGVTGAIPATQYDHPAAIALENALLKVMPPGLLFLFGSLQANAITSGSLALGFSLLGLLPTLPDPYATNYGNLPSAGDSPIGSLGAWVRWPSPDLPQLAFDLALTGGQAGASPAAEAANRAVRITTIGLLDVSSNADQFGVFLIPRRANQIAIDRLSLASAGFNVGVFTLPEISWEPMVSKEFTSDLLNPPNDGGPTVIQVQTAKLVPIAPVPMLKEFVSEVQKGNKPFNVDFTLPFGLKAHAQSSEFLLQGGRFELIQPAFSGPLSGGLQLLLSPPHAEQENAIFPAPSYTETEPPPPPSPTLPSGYGAEVLQPEVARIFEDEFYLEGFRQGIPVRRIDLSGYGASMSSEWREPNASGIQVIKAQFQVFVGRTAYEVIQVQSYKFPFAVRVVRTITIQRTAAAIVVRSDSGWQPATDGEFGYPISPEFTADRIQPGAVPGIYHVRNIRENGPLLTVPNPPGEGPGLVSYQPVLYDADVRIDPGLKVLAGGFSGGPGITYVPSKDLVGYIQISHLVGSPQHTTPDPATKADIAELLHTTGPLGGPVSCLVDIGGSGQQMRATSVDVSITDNGADPAIVAALRGAPVLPRQGAWSVAQRKRSESAPAPLDPNFAVPLVRNHTTDPNTWHLADPADILILPNPQTEYGLLQSTGTQKLFFPRPQITQGVSNVNIPVPPKLADVGALLNATGVFPDLGQALSFPSPETLAVGGDALKIDRDWDITDPDRTLVDFVAVKVLLQYKDQNGTPTHVSVHIDPSGWSVVLSKVTFAVVITPLGSDPLLRVVGTAKASSTSSPTVTDLDVVYGGFLDPVQTVFSKLQQLAAFLPGGAGAGLDVSFSNGKLNVRDSYALPNLPLGFGQITDVALDLGLSVQLTPQSLDFTAGIGSESKPFHWLVSPLSGTGVVQVGAKNGDMTVLIQGGLGVGLAIDVGIASGSASIVLAFQVDNRVAPFEFKVLLTGQAEVDVLGGVASASLTLTAVLGIVPDGNFPPQKITVLGGVAVGIHISICWVIDIDFDGSWEFSQTFTSPLS